MSLFAQPGAFLLLVVLVTLLAAGLGLYAWPALEIRRAGQAGALLDREKERLIEENRKLRLEKATLENLHRVEEVAVKELGLATSVVDVPVTKHEHRMWFETDPATRAKWSKRNYYRFLDRWRDRWDLVLDPHPPESHEHGPDHDHSGRRDAE